MKDIINNIAFDFDEVVVDNISLVIKIANELGYDHSIEFDKIRTYCIEQNDVGITYEQLRIVFYIMEKYREYDYNIFPGAEKVLNYVAKETQSVDFVSARRKIPQILLSKIFGNKIDSARFACCHGTDKVEALRNSGKSIIIEDRLETCHVIAKAGLTPIVYNRPWNNVSHPYKTVYDWEDIANLIGMP